MFILLVTVFVAVFALLQFVIALRYDKFDIAFAMSILVISVLKGVAIW